MEQVIRTMVAQHETEILRDFKIREECAMRVLILALSVLGILVVTNNANAGLSTATRDQSASTEPTASADPVASVDPAAPTDPAAFTDQATQQTEDQIGLDKTRRRQVQRWLTDLGFDTRASGKFDEPTRAVIARWQAARGYPNTGFLNARQHEALRTEIVTAAHADSTSSASSDDGQWGTRQ